MANEQRDYYEVLGVARDADQKTIKNTFRKLAMQYHPDRNKSPEAEARFKEIAEAYAILSDPDKRKQYDTRGFAGVADFSAEDLFGGIDFGDLFGDMGFGFNFGGQREGGLFDHLFRHQQRGPSPGRDIEVQVMVSLDTINTGGEELVRLGHPMRCEACHGSGAEKGSSPRKCETCDGSGQKILSRKETRDKGSVMFQQIIVCPDCHGKGTFIDNPCKQCHGSGQIDKEESLKVKIPKGAEEGMALRISGHGLPSSSGGPPGDLYVVVRTAPDPRFQRLGADLWRNESIDISDAVLGTEIEVPTLGKAITVKVPPGTQHDEVLRLRGKGLPYFEGSTRGDLKLRIHVVIPKQINDEERKLFEQLRTLNKGQTPKKHWW
ncbi:MAG: molecular chaperone DnaJ [Gammaproteobacteria bacterium]|nr:molecular chaperone DnaJ [Gammaproteobacteria bacterium]